MTCHWYEHLIVAMVTEAFQRAKERMVTARENLKKDYIETLKAFGDEEEDADWTPWKTTVGCNKMAESLEGFRQEVRGMSISGIETRRGYLSCILLKKTLAMNIVWYFVMILPISSVPFVPNLVLEFPTKLWDCLYVVKWNCIQNYFTLVVSNISSCVKKMSNII